MALNKAKRREVGLTLLELVVASDLGLIEVKADSEGYPESLEVLVEGVQVGPQAGHHKVRFLRRIPKDPMTGRADWTFRCVKDPPDSRFWCGDNVFDVRGTAGFRPAPLRQQDAGATSIGTACGSTQVKGARILPLDKLGVISLPGNHGLYPSASSLRPRCARSGSSTEIRVF